jgi:hypothetical protein
MVTTGAVQGNEKSADPPAAPEKSLQSHCGTLH